MIKFIRDCIPGLIVLLLCFAASAQQFGMWGPDWVVMRRPVLYTATCNSDTSNLTTYTHTVTITGVDDHDQVVVVVGVVAEDAAGDFRISSATVDGNATAIQAQRGANSTFSGFLSTTAAITGAASVDVAVTYSEAITSSVVCVWAFENLEDNIPSFVAGTTSGTGGGLMTQTPSYTTRDGYILAVCADATNSGVTFTWVGPTAVQDTGNGEFEYSNAEIAVVGDEEPLTSSCDPSGAGDVSSALAVYGNQGYGPALGLYRSACTTDNVDRSTYTFSGRTITSLTDAQLVDVVVGVFAEDGAIDFNVTGLTIEGAAATEITDSVGVGQAVQASMHRTSAPIYNAASVDIEVTFSETVTSAGVCVWALESVGGRAVKTTASANNDAASGSSVNLQLRRGTPDGGYVLAVGVSAGTGARIGWTGGITEVEDADATEFAFSNADILATGGMLSKNDTSGTARLGFDNGGASAKAGAAVAFR